MPQFLVAIHHPDDYDPSVEDQAMIRDISELNREMIAAGVRTFVAGLEPARKAKSVRAKADGKVVVTDGPYIESKEHVGGFWVLDVAGLDDALEWARKAAKACRAPVEVRACFQRPPSAKK
ncbi:MAG TPA: YciI family protein [Gemmatimonadaceae bacterium]|nr:YciI family protein [Gemmatimonadaceae bacterium]